MNVRTLTASEINEQFENLHTDLVQCREELKNQSIGNERLRDSLNKVIECLASEKNRAVIAERALKLACEYIDSYVDTIQRLKDVPCPDHFIAKAKEAQ